MCIGGFYLLTFWSSKQTEPINLPDNRCLTFGLRVQRYAFFFNTDAKKDKVRCKNTEKQQYARVIHLRYCVAYLVGCHVVLYNFGRKGLMGR